MPVTRSEDLFDLTLPSGRVKCRRIGAEDQPLTVLVHGLSAHMHGFDQVAERLASPGRCLVMIDLRGRGRSEITASGSYGLDSHCSDVLEVASRRGAERFDLVGWSMGALIGILAANRAPGRIRRLVLIDHAGRMDPEAVGKIVKGLMRLDMVVETRADYVAAIRAAGAISAWTPFWERYFDYELGPFDEGFKPTTSRAACLEDLEDTQRRDWPSLWSGVKAPALLVRCQNPLGGGFIVPESVRDAIKRAIPLIRVVEDSSDHYTVMTSEPAARAMRAFLDE
jgi:pimeloyl-ACP methyl ester carboxylesterase